MASEHKLHVRWGPLFFLLFFSIPLGLPLPFLNESVPFLYSVNIYLLQLLAPFLLLMYCPWQPPYSVNVYLLQLPALQPCGLPPTDPLVPKTFWTFLFYPLKKTLFITIMASWREVMAFDNGNDYSYNPANLSLRGAITGAKRLAWRALLLHVLEDTQISGGIWQYPEFQRSWRKNHKTLIYNSKNYLVQLRNHCS